MRPDKIARDKVGNTIISTIRVHCLKFYGDYETAVITKDGQETIIRVVNCYDTEEQAFDGHKKYLNMTEDELRSLEHI